MVMNVLFFEVWILLQLISSLRYFMLDILYNHIHQFISLVIPNQNFLNFIVFKYHSNYINGFKYMKAKLHVLTA